MKKRSNQTQYLKCRWCGSSLNDGFRHCPNCHKSQNPVLGKIGGIAGLIAVLSAGAAFYQLKLAADERENATLAAENANMALIQSQKLHTTTREIQSNINQLALKIRASRIESEEILVNVKRFDRSDDGIEEVNNNQNSDNEGNLTGSGSPSGNIETNGGVSPENSGVIGSSHQILEDPMLSDLKLKIGTLRNELDVNGAEYTRLLANRKVLLSNIQSNFSKDCAIDPAIDCERQLQLENELRRSSNQLDQLDGNITENVENLDLLELEYVNLLKNVPIKN